MIDIIFNIIAIEFVIFISFALALATVYLVIVVKLEIEDCIARRKDGEQK